MDMISDNAQWYFFLVNLNFPFLPAKLCERVSDPMATFWTPVAVVSKGRQKPSEQRKYCGRSSQQLPSSSHLCILQCFVMFLKHRAVRCALSRYSGTEIMVEKGSNQEKVCLTKQMMHSWCVNLISWLQSPNWCQGYRKWLSDIQPSLCPSSPVIPGFPWTLAIPCLQRRQFLPWASEISYANQRADIVISLWILANMNSNEMQTL